MQDDFLKKMENLQKPEINNLPEMQEFKMVLLNSKKSATLGIWLVAVPLFFLFCVCMKYAFHINLHFFDEVQDTVSSLDKSTVIPFLGAILLVGFPIAGFAINALSLIHVQIEKYPVGQKLLISIKIQWANIIIMTISFIIVCIFLLYLISENFSHQ
jgi:lantibiotic transport system permease protein